VEWVEDSMSRKYVGKLGEKRKVIKEWADKEAKREDENDGERKGDGKRKGDGEGGDGREGGGYPICWAFVFKL